MPSGRRTNTIFSNTLFAFPFILFIYIAVAPGTYAAESRIDSHISLSQAYNDNLTFTVHNPMDDLIFMAEPGLKWDYQTDRTLTTTSAELTHYGYKDEHELNRTDQQYNLRHTWAITEKSGLSVAGTYKKDNTISQRTEDTGILFDTSDRTIYQIAPSCYWNLTERTRAELAGGYADGDYESNRYSDYTNKKATISVTHRLSSRNTKLLLEGDYAHQHYPSYYTTIDQYRFYLGFTHPFSERLAITAWSGAKYTETDYQQLVREFLGYNFYLGLFPYPVFRERIESKTEKDWGYIGLIQLTQAYEKGDITLTVQRDIGTSTALGETIEKDSIALNSSYQFIRHLTASLSAEITNEKYNGTGNYAERDIYRFCPSLNWQLKKDIWVDLSYLYLRSEEKIESTNMKNTAERNRIVLSIAIRNEKRL
ncbi:MAG: hypothetical protein SWH61_12155 [Thermodesulfobacteriota bacterium]|nr:hypothetical protein [Thermodesulfobacteriota bacterium]